MSTSTSKIKENEHYNGTRESQSRLVMLFNITKLNLYEYLSYNKQYFEYLSQKINTNILSEYNLNMENNNSYVIDEYNNIQKLNCILFNVLTSFDALKRYIYNLLNSDSVPIEIEHFIKIFNNMLIAYCENTNNTINVGDLLHEARNAFIHNGRPIAQIRIELYNNIKTPIHMILVNRIWPLEYSKEKGLSDDNYFIDAFEIFSNMKKAFSLLEIHLKKLDC